MMPKIYQFDFSEEENESPYVQLPLPDTAECYRLLASKTINCRFVKLFGFFALVFMCFFKVNNGVGFQVKRCPCGIRLINLSNI